jgi:hypothetical protein
MNSVTFGTPDYVPLPRCQLSRGDQLLTVVNESATPLTMSLNYTVTLVVPAHGQATWPLPLGSFLAPGVHELNVVAGFGGADIVVDTFVCKGPYGSEQCSISS